MTIIAKFLVLDRKVYRRFAFSRTGYAGDLTYLSLVEVDHSYPQNLDAPKYAWAIPVGQTSHLDKERVMTFSQLMFYLVENKYEKDLIKFLIEGNKELL